MTNVVFLDSPAVAQFYYFIVIKTLFFVTLNNLAITDIKLHLAFGQLLVF